MNIPHSIEICLCMIQNPNPNKVEKMGRTFSFEQRKNIFDFALLLMKKAMGGSDTKL